MADDYKVKPGETFSRIARRYVDDKGDLLSWEELVDTYNPQFSQTPGALPSGSVIKVPGADEGFMLETEMDKQLQAAQYSGDDINLQIENVVSDKNVDPNKKIPLTTIPFFKDGEEVQPESEIPAGHIKTTDVVTQETRKDFNKGRIIDLLNQEKEIKLELAKHGVNVDKEISAAELDRLSQVGELENKFSQEREERLKLQKQREEKLRNEVTAATNEFKSSQVDPERFFNKKGTASKILAALAAGIGAYASAMSGTRNFALEIINQAISDDIEAQKVSIAQKGGLISERRNLLQDLINKGLTDAEAESAAHVIMLNKVQTDLDKKMALIKDSGIKEKGVLLQEQLKIEAELRVQNMLLQAAPLKTKTKTEKTVKIPLSAKDKAIQTALGKSEVEEKRGLTAKEKKSLSVPGFLGTAPTVHEAKEARDAVKKIKEAEITINELITAREEHGFETDFGVLTREEREAAKTKTVLFLGMLKNKLFLDLGVLQEADVKLLNRALPEDPLGASPTKHEAILRQYGEVKRYIQRAGQLYFDSLSLIPETGVRPDFSRATMREQFKASEATYK